MSWPVTPNGTIVLCRQIPLDRQHNNTVDFADASTQAAAIRVYEKTEFDDYSYIGDGRVMVQAARDDIIMCNYMMYRNSGFSNKWFYAFITEINYVNPDTSEIVFEIDNMQTYMFDYQLQRCYVEREHSVTDYIGENLIPENLETGEYVESALTPMFDYSDLAIVILTSQQVGWDDQGGGYYISSDMSRIAKYGGIVSGLSMYICVNDSTSGQSAITMAENFMNDLNSQGYGDSIYAIYMIPRSLINERGIVRVGGTPKYVLTYSGAVPAQSVTISRDNGAFSYGGTTYTPKNKKLHTYPYKLLYLTTLDGNSAEYRYEFFSNANIVFWTRGDMGSGASVICAPYDYKNGGGANFDEKIVLSGFANIACASDAWQAYMAQNANSNQLANLSSALSIVGGAAMIAGGAVSSNPALAVSGATTAAGGISAIATLNGKINDIKARPNHVHGTQGTEALNILELKNIYYAQKQITPEYAKIIDDYFSMFGYATHRVKIPNTNSRPNWNYVKTVDCNIVATSSVNDSTGMDAQAMEDIKAIYNKGVTIWHTLAAVGHYEYSNSPS